MYTPSISLAGPLPGVPVAVVAPKPVRRLDGSLEPDDSAIAESDGSSFSVDAEGSVRRLQETAAPSVGKRV